MGPVEKTLLPCDSIFKKKQQQQTSTFVLKTLTSTMFILTFGSSGDFWGRVALRLEISHIYFEE